MSITLRENFRALFYAPFYAAEAIGAYAAEGVGVHIRPSASPAETWRALAAGEADVIWGGPLRVMLAWQNDPGLEPMCFCDAVARDPFLLVGREPKPDFRLADLAGLRLGTVAEVPTPWICLSEDLRRAGIDPASLARTSGPTMAENARLLKAGARDVVQLFEPDAERLLAAGIGHLWYAAASRGATAYTALIARRATLASRREELGAMVRAMRRSLHWIAATPGREVGRALGGWFPEVSPDLFAAAIDRYRGLDIWSHDAVVRRDGFARLQAAMLADGILARPTPFECCVDTSIAAAA